MNILYIAPYPDKNNRKHGSPGAARKISLTIQLLTELGHDVILLNSSNNYESGLIYRKETLTEQTFGGRRVKVITLPMMGTRKISKLFNVVFLKIILKKILSDIKIDVIVIYNTYLFEASAAKLIYRKMGLQYIVQLEDLPWSRRRGLFNIKANLETKEFASVCKKAFLILCVSNQVMNVVKKLNNNVELYPPIIDKKVIDMGNVRKPPFTEKKIHIGIFGGLNKEKGADKAFDLIASLDDEYIIHVAGKGPLGVEFERLKRKNIRNYQYYGYVDDDEYIEMITSMDILINPHVELDKLSNGVFPFKLYEYIGSGAYVITTPIPYKEKKLLNKICVFDGSSADLINKIMQAKLNYDSQENSILRDRVIKYAGYDSVRDRLYEQIKNIGA